MNTVLPVAESEGLVGLMAAYVEVCQVLVIEGSSIMEGDLG